MRVILKPTIDASFVYSKCLNSIANRVTRDKFRSVKSYIKIKSDEYDNKASIGELYTISRHSDVNGILTKNDMKNILYTQQMVRKPKGRAIYNRLMALAPLSRCPFCGIGTVSTLDHYLVKSEFPTYSILPYNLVPCCKDCNTGKGNSFTNIKEKQALHPYYDDFTDKQWLFAEVKKTFPLSVEFSVNAPIEWDDVSKARVEAHFIEYDLKSRFTVEATNELAKLNNGFKLYPLKKRLRKKQLQKRSQIL